MIKLILLKTRKDQLGAHEEILDIIEKDKLLTQTFLGLNNFYTINEKLIKLYLKENNFEKAISTANRFIKNYNHF